MYFVLKILLEVFYLSLTDCMLVFFYVGPSYGRKMMTGYLTAINYEKLCEIRLLLRNLEQTTAACITSKFITNFTITNMCQNQG